MADPGRVPSAPPRERAERPPLGTELTDEQRMASTEFLSPEETEAWLAWAESDVEEPPAWLETSSPTPGSSKRSVSG
jgi:hypothetical protein